MKYAVFDNNLNALLKLDETHTETFGVHKIEDATLFEGNAYSAPRIIRNELPSRDIEIIADPIDSRASHYFPGRGFFVKWFASGRTFELNAVNDRTESFFRSEVGTKSVQIKLDELNNQVINRHPDCPLSRNEINKIVGQISATVARNIGKIPKLSRFQSRQFELDSSRSKALTPPSIPPVARTRRKRRNDKSNAFGVPMSPEDFQ